MEQSFHAGGEACAINQPLYNMAERGAEFDVLPPMPQQHIPVIAYSPIGQGALPTLLHVRLPPSAITRSRFKSLLLGWCANTKSSPPRWLEPASYVVDNRGALDRLVAEVENAATTARSPTRSVHFS